MKWLQENNRIQWMCEKLAALYLMENNFEIKKINHKNFSDDGLSIFAISPDNQIVLFKVIQKSFAGDKEEVMHVMKKDALLNKISSSELSDDYEIENIVPRVDALTVELIKNKSPRIEHFKGIINC